MKIKGHLFEFVFAAFLAWSVAMYWFFPTRPVIVAQLTYKIQCDYIGWEGGSAKPQWRLVCDDGAMYVFVSPKPL